MKEMQTKDAVRRQMRARRKALTPEERELAAKAVCAKLRSDDDIADADVTLEGGGAIAVYLASPDEIDLSEFILELLNAKPRLSRRAGTARHTNLRRSRDFPMPICVAGQ